MPGFFGSAQQEYGNRPWSSLLRWYGISLYFLACNLLLYSSSRSFDHYSILIDLL